MMRSKNPCGCDKLAHHWHLDCSMKFGKQMHQVLQKSLLAPCCKNVASKKSNVMNEMALFFFLLYVLVCPQILLMFLLWTVFWMERSMWHVAGRWAQSWLTSLPTSWPASPNTRHSKLIGTLMFVLGFDLMNVFVHWLCSSSFQVWEMLQRPSYEFWLQWDSSEVQLLADCHRPRTTAAEPPTDTQCQGLQGPPTQWVKALTSEEKGPSETKIKRAQLKPHKGLIKPQEAADKRWLTSVHDIWSNSNTQCLNGAVA